MDYEQKYKEALKVIESLYNVVRYQSSTDALFASQTIEKAFPELKENEDEKIRKEIIAYLDVQEVLAQGKDGDFKEWIAWLEKQKPVEWSEDDEECRKIALLALNNHPLNQDELKAFYWLKSLKPNRWKPSEEQMEALLYALGKGGTYNKEALTQLYNNLKTF